MVIPFIRYMNVVERKHIKKMDISGNVGLLPKMKKSAQIALATEVCLGSA